MITGTVVGFVGALTLWLLKEWLFPDLLDFRKQARQSERERQAELRANEREDLPIRQRLAVAIRTECEALYRVYIKGEFSIAEWQSWHDALKALIESDAAARALREKYPAFADILKYDQLSINVQVKHESEWTAPPKLGTITSPSAAYRIAMHDAYLEQNVSTVLLRFAPLLGWLGFEEDAVKFETAGTEHLALANATLSRPPIY